MAAVAAAAAESLGLAGAGGLELQIHQVGHCSIVLGRQNQKPAESSGGRWDSACPARPAAWEMTIVAARSSAPTVAWLRLEAHCWSAPPGILLMAAVRSDKPAGGPRYGIWVWVGWRSLSLETRAFPARAANSRNTALGGWSWARSCFAASPGLTILEMDEEQHFVNLFWLPRPLSAGVGRTCLGARCPAH